MNLENFTINENSTLNDVLKLIELNKHGIVFTTNSSGRVTGAITDGDIRRQLIESVSLSQQVSSILTGDFVWAGQDTPRETILKQLDHRIKVIPILNERGLLTDIVSRDRMPLQLEESTYVRSRSPVRISFGGGGSDLTYFFADHLGAVINATIAMYTHVTLRKRNDSAIHISSQDLQVDTYAENLEAVLAQNGKLTLIQAILKTIKPDFGFDLHLNSDFPMCSGLGGSSAVAAAVLGGFNQFRSDKWNQYELAELAFQAERLCMGVSGGWQDQYATVFGGFNFIEFNMKQNIVHPLRIQNDIMSELEESLVLCNTKSNHSSDLIHKDQKKRMSEEYFREKQKANVKLTYDMRNHLLRGQLMDFGLCLHEAWRNKREFSEQIAPQWVNSIYEKAISEGSVGGKLLGAGGGGFFLFFVPPFKKNSFTNALQDLGLLVQPFRFEANGLQSWSVREDQMEPRNVTNEF